MAYICWDIFSGYSKLGHICFKELFNHFAEALLGKEATVLTNLPDKAVVTLTKQEKENRLVLHLLFAHTTLRGQNTEVVEDTVPLYNVLCSVKCDNKPLKITLEPEGKEIPFEYENGRVSFTVQKFDIHQMVVIEN